MNSISRREQVKINKKEDIKKAYTIMREYSTDSMHYLSLKEENIFYFGTKVKGFISFILVGKNAMSLGDPVCKDEELNQLVEEYIFYCESNKWKPIFTSVSYNLAMILQEKKQSNKVWRRSYIKTVGIYIGRRKKSLTSTKCE